MNDGIPTLEECAATMADAQLIAMVVNLVKTAKGYAAAKDPAPHEMLVDLEFSMRCARLDHGLRRDCRVALEALAANNN